MRQDGNTAPCGCECLHSAGTSFSSVCCLYFSTIRQFAIPWLFVMHFLFGLTGWHEHRSV